LSKLSKWIGLFKVEFDKHSPEILTGLGITGMFASVIFSIQATPKAMKSIEEKKKELNKEKLSVGETIEACWKHYIPTAVTLATSTACVIGANSVNTRRNAALAAAYSISETALTEYRDKVKEIIGENKEKDIRADIVRDKVNSDPPSANTQLIVKGKGSTLFFEPISGRYFYSEPEKVRQAALELGSMMLSETYISVNDVFVMLGLPTTNRVNDYLIWDVNNGYLKIDFDYVPYENDVCWVIIYSSDPIPKKFA